MEEGEDVRSVNIATGVLVAFGMLITAACGSSTGTSNTPSSSAATPSATAAAGGKPFGTTITASSGAMYTVLAWQPVQSKSATANTPVPGAGFFATNVQECAGSGPAFTTDPTAWHALLSGGEVVDGRDASLVATPGPPLPTGATVASGQCVGGWVAFTGFADGIGRQVRIAGLDSFWFIP
jgi:hypothetical protein